MALSVIHDKIEDIPEPFRELYTEKDGKFLLTGIEGIKTQADIDRINEGLRKERDDHKKTRERFKAFEGLNADEVLAKLDKYDELEAAASGKLDDDKINEIAEKRVKSRLAPVERELLNVKKQNEELTSLVAQYQAKERTRTIHDAVRQAATKHKVLDTAQEDVLMLAERVFEVSEDGKVVAKEGVGVTPGIDADLWLQEMQQKRPHWWAPSSGGGGTGSGAGAGMANNPWSSDHWNLTKQGEYIRQHGTEKAAQMAKLAGVKLGATGPVRKK